MIRESEIEDYLVKGVARLGGMCRKLSYPGRRGAPDRLIVLPYSLVAFAEVKSPTGKVSQHQAAELKRLEKLHQHTFVVSTKEEVDECLNSLQDLINAV